MRTSEGNQIACSSKPVKLMGDPTQGDGPSRGNSSVQPERRKDAARMSASHSWLCLDLESLLHELVIPSRSRPLSARTWCAAGAATVTPRVAARLLRTTSSPPGGEERADRRRVEE